MSKESQARINRYAKLIESGEWEQSIRDMAADDLSYEAILNLCDSINFYPSNDFCKYAKDVTAHKTNKEALDSFFATNI